MAYPIRLRAEAVRAVAFGAVTGAFAALGAATTHIGRIVRLVNYTDQIIDFSLDGVDEHYILSPTSFLVLDLSANQTKKDNFFIPQGQVFYIRHTGAAPTTGSCWIELSYGG